MFELNVLVGYIYFNIPSYWIYLLN